MVIADMINATHGFPDLVIEKPPQSAVNQTTIIRNEINKIGSLIVSLLNKSPSVIPVRFTILEILSSQGTPSSYKKAIDHGMKMIEYRKIIILLFNGEK